MTMSSTRDERWKMARETGSREREREVPVNHRHPRFEKGGEKREREKKGEKRKEIKQEYPLYRGRN